jgi:hypothetical protein
MSYRIIAAAATLAVLLANHSANAQLPPPLPIAPIGLGPLPIDPIGAATVGSALGGQGGSNSFLSQGGGIISDLISTGSNGIQGNLQGQAQGTNVNTGTAVNHGNNGQGEQVGLQILNAIGGITGQNQPVQNQGINNGLNGLQGQDPLSGLFNNAGINTGINQGVNTGNINNANPLNVLNNANPLGNINNANPLGNINNANPLNLINNANPLNNINTGVNTGLNTGVGNVGNFQPIQGIQNGIQGVNTGVNTGVPGTTNISTAATTLQGILQPNGIRTFQVDPLGVLTSATGALGAANPLGAVGANPLGAVTGALGGANPLGAVTGALGPANPINTIAGPGNPINSLTGPGNPINSLTGPGNPINSLTGPGNPLNTIAGPGNPINTLTGPGNPLNTIAGPGNPINTLTGPGGPVGALGAVGANPLAATSGLAPILNTAGPLGALGAVPPVAIGVLSLPTMANPVE